MAERKKKNLVNKSQGWDPIHQKYKANENTSKHNQSKNKSKQSTKIRAMNHGKVDSTCKASCWYSQL
jgi:hypothetical protein